MKVSLPPILEALGYVSAAAETKTTIPILTHVLWEGDGERLRFVATDLESTLEESFESELVVPAIALPAKPLIALLRRFDPEEPVEIDSAAERLTVSQEARRVQLAGMPGEEFPQVPDVGGEDVELQTAALQRAAEAVRHAAPKDETRFAVVGAVCQLAAPLTLMATDGHRLALSGSEEVDTSKLPILPLKALDSIGALAGDAVAIRVGEHHWSLRSRARSAVFRKLDVTPNDARSTIRGMRERGGAVSCNREALIEALLTAATLPSEMLGSDGKPMAASVAFEVADKAIRISRWSAYGEVVEEVPATVDGEFRTGMNPSYLVDLLKSVAGDEVELWYKPTADATEGGSLYYESTPDDEGRREIRIVMGVRMPKTGGGK